MGPTDSAQMLTPGDVSELRGLALERALPEHLPELTLAAAVELACTGWMWRQEAADVSAFAGWTRKSARLEEAWRAITTQQIASDRDYTAYAREVRSISSPDAASRLAERFRKSLVENGGFAHDVAGGLAGALAEMVDNVGEHSAPTGEPPARAIAAYEVARGAFEFSVADVGRGALASLHENPRWADLRSTEAALDAIVLEHASRRVGEGAGQGFSVAVRALADLGSIRIRSTDRYVVVATAGRWASRVGAKGSIFPLVGLSIAAQGASRP